MRTLLESSCKRLQIGKMTYSPQWGQQTVWHEGIGRCCAWRH